METQKTPNSQSSLEKEEWSWRNQSSWLQIMLQSYNHQDSMVLAQEQKYRPMEQDRKSRNKPMHLWVPFFWLKRQEYTMGIKAASSINGARKTQQLSSVHFSCLVVSDSLRPYESQHARPPCPSATPGVHWDSHPSSQWCHPAISSSVIPFSSCPQSLGSGLSFYVGLCPHFFSL